MTWSISTWAKLVLALTVVAAVFLVAPIADAATCAPELPAAHASIDHDPTDGDHGGSGDTHGVCAHGHCHHNGAARNDDHGASTLRPYARPVHDFPSSEFPASISPDGLKRPPRV